MYDCTRGEYRTGRGGLETDPPRPWRTGRDRSKEKMLYPNPSLNANAPQNGAGSSLTRTNTI